MKLINRDLYLNQLISRKENGLIIITQDLGKPWRNEKGYLIINIFDFLLNPNSLDL